MGDLEKHIIKSDYTIIRTLQKLEELSKDSVMTVFVVNDNFELLGTVTAGDIRRALIKGYCLESKIEHVMNVNFTFLTESYFDTDKLRYIKEKDLKLIPVLDKNKCLSCILDFQKKKSYLPLDAVLMAGGKGERLRSLTEKTPKPLLKVGEKAIIDYNIDNLISFGVSHINVTTNYLGEQIEKHFEELRDGVKINCVREPQYLGTIGSIKFVETFYHDTVLLMNSDLFTNIDFEDFFLHFHKNNADMSVAAIPYSVSVPYGIFELDERKIKGVKEKPTYNYYANSGIYLIKRKLLDLIPDGVFFNATDFMEKLIQEGYNVIRFPLVGYWIDIGKHEDYRKAQEFVKHIT